jgi:hypothetical protein
MKFQSCFLCCVVSVSALACSVDREGRAPAPRDDASESPATAADAGASEADLDGSTSAHRDAGEDPHHEPPDGGVHADAGPKNPADPRDAVLGSYALKRTFARVEQIRGAFRDDLAQLTTDYTRVEIVKDGKAYLLRERGCRREVTSRGNLLTDIQVTIADAVPQSLPEMESVLEVSVSGEHVRFEKAESQAPLGFVAQFDSDPLPQSLDDARVRDGDGDGKPAVTVHVRVGAALEGDEYFVQWNRTRYSAERDAQGNFSGENFDRSEQIILGTTPGDEALASPRTVRDAEDTSHNRVELVRLEKPLDCAGMLGELDRLFPD